jgi:hypothetical protein
LLYATPTQPGFNASLLGRIQAVKFIRHNTSRIFRAAPNRRRSPVARTRFKVLIWIKSFGGRGGLNEQIFGADEQNKSPARSYHFLFGPNAVQGQIRSIKRTVRETLDYWVGLRVVLGTIAPDHSGSRRIPDSGLVVFRLRRNTFQIRGGR